MRVNFSGRSGDENSGISSRDERSSSASCSAVSDIVARDTKTTLVPEQRFTNSNRDYSFLTQSPTRFNQVWSTFPMEYFMFYCALKFLD